MPSRRARPYIWPPRALVPNLTRSAASALIGSCHASQSSCTWPWHEILLRPRPPPREIPTRRMAGARSTSGTRQRCERCYKAWSWLLRLCTGPAVTVGSGFASKIIC